MHLLHTSKASINRLSGRLIVENIDQFRDPRVLDSNVFSCSDIPLNDDTASTYSCGSSALENAMWTWLGYLAPVLFTALVCRLSQYFIQHDAARYIWDSFKRWRKEIDPDLMWSRREVRVRFPNTLLMLNSLKILAEYMSYTGLVIFLVTSIVYICLKTGRD